MSIKCRPSSRSRSSAATPWSPPKRSFTPREKYGRLKLTDIKPGAPYSNPPPPPKPQRPNQMTSDEFYTAIVNHGPDMVWPMHYESLVLPVEEKEEEGECPASCWHQARPSISSPRPLLFPRRNPHAATPGLHRAVVPKLYALQSWHPRLYHLILPKYLLAMDSQILAQLYRCLGRIQPSPPKTSNPESTINNRASVDKQGPEVDDEPSDQHSSYYTHTDLSAAVMERERTTFELMTLAIGKVAMIKLRDEYASPEILPALIRGLVECGIHLNDPDLLEAWEDKCRSSFRRLTPRHLAEIAVSLGSAGLLPPPAWLASFHHRIVQVQDSKLMGIDQLTPLIVGLAAMKRNARRQEGSSRGPKIKGAFGLLSASRRLLSSKWPQNGSQLTAPLVFLAALNEEIDWGDICTVTGPLPRTQMSWLQWYRFYVEKVLNERPEVMEMSDLCILLNALADILSCSPPSMDSSTQGIDSILDLALSASRHLVSEANKEYEESESNRMVRLISRSFVSAHSIHTQAAMKDRPRARTLLKTIDELAMIATTSSLDCITKLNSQDLVEASHSALHLLQKISSRGTHLLAKNLPSEENKCTAWLVQAWAVVAVLHSQSANLLTTASHEELYKIARIIIKLFLDLSPLLSPDESCRTKAIPVLWFVAILNQVTLNPEDNGSINGETEPKLPEGWVSLPLSAAGMLTKEVSQAAWSTATSSYLLPQFSVREDATLELLHVLLQAPGSSEALLLMAREEKLRVIGSDEARSWRDVLVAVVALCTARSLDDDRWRDLGDKYQLFLSKHLSQLAGSECVIEH